MSQSNFPACPVNHNPVYYCCTFGDEGKLLYTRFQRPEGRDYASFYAEGWQATRQVNLVATDYRPDTPSFRYDEPNAVCRVQQRVRSDGTLDQEIQCGTATEITNDLSGTIIVNASLATSSRDTNVYWAAGVTMHNNNASFPVGANCTSLMTKNGGMQVDEDAKAACVPPVPSVTCRVHSFTVVPMLVIYSVYALFLMVLILWVPIRCWLASIVLTKRTTSKHNRLGPAAPHLLTMNSSSNYNNNGRKYLIDEPTRLTIPVLMPRSTELDFLRASADAIEQTGYQDSRVGKFVLGYLIFATIGLFPLLIIVVLDANSQFTPMLFDPTNALVSVYLVLWLTLATWLVLLVTFHHRLLNFFRVKLPLDRCEYVRMFNPDLCEITMPDSSGISSCIAKIERFLFPHSRQGNQETVKVQTNERGVRFVEFQQLRYTYDAMYGKFVPGYVSFPETFAQILLECSDGLLAPEYIRRIEIVGKNDTEVPMPTLARSAVDEICCFFYVYQFMCCFIWFFTTRWQIATLNLGILGGVVTLNTIYRRRMLADVLKITKIRGDVVVQRDVTWQTIPASELVPGDLVKVKENWEVPCDLVVIKGSVHCDESALTGESMPVQKFPIPTNSTQVYDPTNPMGKQFTLFAGTKVLPSGHYAGGTLAVVRNTGTLTVRGRLLQSILYPSLVRFKYNEHLKACIVFLSFVGVVAACLAMTFLSQNAGLSNKLFAAVYGISVLSVVMNPLLLVVVTIGQTNASRRLQKCGIFCLNHERIALGGKVRVFAFDKTGTITKEGLDFRGCLPTQLFSGGSTQKHNTYATFLGECTNATSPNLNIILKFALASCHSVRYLQEELVGSEVEVKMFRSTDWILIEEETMDTHGHEVVRTIVQSPDGRHALRPIKQFEFDHTRKCMSVIVQDLRTQRRFLFCKGAFEKMHEICERPTIPNDYMVRAERLARDGCYVLGVGFKELPSPYKGDDSWLQRQSRDEMESGLLFLGFIMFQNELKEDSRRVISTLQGGDVRVVMITGDSAFTACYIGRESGMVRAGAKMLLGEIRPINKDGGKALMWKDVDTHEVLSSKDIYRLLSSPYGAETNIELAVTGEAFNYLGKMGELTKFLFHIRIFSRMSPVEKADCIAEMMAAGAITGMCGDGGNDCGALRIAHVGVALSGSEASVVSPFTSHTKSIRSVVDICREGRCSLATSFGNLMFLMIYGLIACGMRFTMYHNSVFVSKYAFLFCDGFILVGLSYALSLAKPLRVLGNERPTSSLIGPTTMLSVLGQTLIHYGFLYWQVHLLMSAPWYCPFNPDNKDLAKWWQLEDNYLATVLFLVTASQQIISGFSLGFGGHFREPIYKNVVLVVYFLLLVAAIGYLALSEPNALTDRFRIATSTNVVGLPLIPLPHSFQLQLVGVTAINMITIAVFEFFVISGPVRKFCRNRFHRDRLQIRV